jgi:hypothetical protein
MTSPLQEDDVKQTNDPRQLELPLTTHAQTQECTMRKNEAYPRKYFRAKDYPEGWTITVEVEMARMESFENGKSDDEKMVVYFRKQKSGLVIGPTVWDQFIEVTGKEDCDEWKGHRVELYRDWTKFQGDDVECIRVRKAGEPPKKPTKKLAPKDDKPDFNDSIEF